MSQNILPVRLVRHFTLLLILTTALGWAQARLTPEKAITRVGESATVCGMVASARYAAKSKGDPIFLNLGKPYPQHVFTVIIWGRWRSRFSYISRILCRDATSASPAQLPPRKVWQR